MVDNCDLSNFCEVKVYVYHQKLCEVIIVQSELDSRREQSMYVKMYVLHIVCVCVCAC